MRTSLDLLNEIVGMAFDQKKTLTYIDKTLDAKLGIAGRKPLSDEKLSDNLYNDILNVFITEAKKKSLLMK